MRALWWILSLAVLVAAAFLVRLPLLALEPGPTFQVDELVEFAQPPPDQLDDLLVTAVRVEPTTAVGWVESLLASAETVVPAAAVTPPGVEPEEFAEQQRQVFFESVRVAAAVGLRQAGRQVEVSGEGVRVQAVVPGSPAAQVLQEGDRIIAVEGEEIELASELAAVTAAAEEGEQLRLTIVRGGEERQVTVGVTQLAQVDRPGIGILATTVNQQIDLPVEVEAAEDLEVAGPSAGLMLALGIYDAFTEGDLTGGRVVAGTGSVDPSGRVGIVGGIGQKVRAAVRDGADVFLVPEEEEEAAREAAPPELEVIAVGTVEEAIAALQQA